MLFASCITLLLIIATPVPNIYGYTPLVMYHGMGDACSNPLSMGSIQKLIESEAKDIYVHCLKFGSNFAEDIANGFFLPCNEQIEKACDKIKNDKKLSGGYNAIGFSQGGQFLRAIAQRCPDPPMKNLISVGGQHQGVFGFPRCNADTSTTCNVVRSIIGLGVYTKLVQDTIVQAEYWHDSNDEKEYRAKSQFIAEINMQSTTFKNNTSAKTNLQKLNKFVMVKFLNDTMVEPRESEWFGFYAPNSKTVLKMEDTDLYQDDLLGLAEMNKAGKLTFLATIGDHLQFTKEWFIKHLMPYIKE